MRSKKAFINISASVLCHGVTIAMAFWARRVLADYLGFELVGVVNVFTSLVTMLSLSELGLGTAAVQIMYRPLAEGDYQRAASITAYSGRLYRWISAMIIVLGVAAIPLLPRLTHGEYGFSYLAGVYIPVVLGTAISYLSASRKNLLLADQKGYAVSAIQLAFRMVANLAQIWLIIRFRDYRYYLYAKIAFDLLENGVAYAVCCRICPFAGGKAAQISQGDRKLLGANIYSLAFHRVGQYLISGTDNIVISIFMGERVVAFCAGSLMVINAVSDFFGQMFNALSSGMGHMLATESRERVMEIFNGIFLAQHFLASFSCVTVSVLLDPFIRFWMGTEAVLAWPVKAVMVVNFYLVIISQPLGTLRASGGIFQPDRYLHVGLAALNIVLSIALAEPLGAAGVYLGTLACLLVKEVGTLPRIVDKHLINGFARSYYPVLGGYAFLTFAEVSAALWLASLVLPENQYLRFILKAALCAVFPTGANLLILSRRASFRMLKGTVAGVLEFLRR